jgi:hypothetical protein
VTLRRLSTCLLLCTVLVSSAACSWNKRGLKGDLEALEDPIFPDERRSGIAGLQKRREGKQDVYLERFRTMAVTDSSPQVRGQAVRALNQARDGQAVPVYLQAIRENEPRVQIEGVKALRHAPDDRAVARLLELASAEQTDRDVRIWATRALGCYPRLDVANRLAGLLTTRDFSVAYEARSSLWFMTGKDFHYDPALWGAWLTRPQGTPFRHQGPTGRPK